MAGFLILSQAVKVRILLGHPIERYLMIKFEISAEDKEKIDRWLTQEVYPDVIAKQKLHIEPNFVAIDCWENGFPYEGAIGGGITYSFAPTSIGLVTKVQYGVSYELDLTDYDSW